jgi:thioredoxin reductase (NADPH)
MRVGENGMPKVEPLRLYGKRGCPSAYAIRDFLQRSDIPFEWIELRDNEYARNELGVENVDDARLPICIFNGGTRMERPTVRQITEKLGWFRNPSCSEYDLAIYGAGPARLSASVYGASEGLKTVLVERFAVGGQAGTSPKIENYLGFPEGITGADLAERAREQALRFGAELLIHRAGVRGEFTPCNGVVELDDGTKIISRVSVCATGVEYRRPWLAERGQTVRRRRLLWGRGERGPALRQRARGHRGDRQFFGASLTAPRPTLVR